MNRQIGIGIIIGAVAVTAIGGVTGYRIYESSNYAEVLSVDPVMITVNVPREECRDVVVTKQAPTKDPKQVTGTVAGAVIGGLLGNQIGGGTGKTLATVGGAVAGGYAGNKVQEGVQERNTYQEVQQKCETVYDSHEEQDGFDVSYRWQGVEKSVRMDHDPGDRIPVENGELVLEQPR
jgi:uncharacterized protein YcfJ